MFIYALSSLTSLCRICIESSSLGFSSPAASSRLYAALIVAYTIRLVSSLSCAIDIAKSVSVTSSSDTDHIHCSASTGSSTVQGTSSPNRYPSGTLKSSHSLSSIGRSGFRISLSHLDTVPNVTPINSARSSCRIPRSIRSSFSLDPNVVIIVLTTFLFCVFSSYLMPLLLVCLVYKLHYGLSHIFSAYIYAPWFSSSLPKCYVVE